MPVDVRVYGAKQLERLARELEEQSTGRDLRLELLREIRGVAKPIAVEQKATLAQRLPHRGGLAATVSGEGKATVRSRTQGRGVGVRIIDSWKGHDMPAIDRGAIRHPVFGRWLKGQRSQAIPPHSLTDPFLANRPRVQRGVLRAMDKISRKIARSPHA